MPRRPPPRDRGLFGLVGLVRVVGLVDDDRRAVHADRDPRRGESRAERGERIVLSGSFVCGGDWAFNTPTIADSGGTQTVVNLALRWNGTAWQVVNRAAYCESGGIPKAVAQKACQVK